MEKDYPSMRNLASGKPEKEKRGVFFLRTSTFPSQVSLRARRTSGGLLAPFYWSIIVSLPILSRRRESWGNSRLSSPQISPPLAIHLTPSMVDPSPVCGQDEDRVVGISLGIPAGRRSSGSPFLVF